MGLFNSRNRAERAELRKHKKSLKSVSRANKRERQIGEYTDKTRLLKAKSAYKKAKTGGKARPLFDITIGKKKQGKKLGGKQRIRLI